MTHQPGKAKNLLANLALRMLLECHTHLYGAEKYMSSLTKRVKTRRALRKAKAGKKRKNYINLHGSTQPDLELNQPNAHEKAVAKKA